jgi:endonuclease YncB( thermonuclease family)
MSVSASRLIVLITVAIALSLAACSRPTSTSLFAQTSSAGAAQIVVLRDDILIVDGRHVRLSDASLPQAAPLAHCAAEAIASRQAELRLSELAHGVHQALVAPTGGVDEGGRTLARVLFDGVDPAQTLINEGLAVTAQQNAFDWCGPMSATAPISGHIALLSYAGA